MRHGFHCSLLALITLAVSGCVKHSVVIKINPDGTGVVHVRHFEEAPSGLFSDSAEKKQVAVPSREVLQKLAKAMGPGVTARPVKRSKDANGWEGYEILFDVKDVNRLVLDKASLKDLMRVRLGKTEGSDAEVTEKPDTEGASDSSLIAGVTLRELKVRLRNGVLTLQPKFGSGSPSTSEPGETVDPFAGTAGTGGFAGKVALSMASQFLGAARAGLFVQAEPGIEKTNARFVNGKQIAIMRVNLGQIASPANLEKNLALLDELTAISGQSPKLMQEVCDKVKGLDVDMTETIAVRLK